MLEIGMKGKQEVIADETNSAKTMGSGTLDDSGNDRIDGKDCMDKRCRRTG